MPGHQAVLGCLVMAVVAALVGFPCVLQPLVRVAHASVPQDLTNFQNEYACDLKTLIVR